MGGREWSLELRRALDRGAVVIESKTRWPVVYEPRYARDCYPWIDKRGLRWRGSECQAVNPIARNRRLPEESQPKPRDDGYDWTALMNENRR